VRWTLWPVRGFRIESRIEDLASGFDTKHWQVRVRQEADLPEHGGLVPVNVLVRELVPPKSHNRNQWNFHSAISGSDTRQHPRNLLGVRERKDHLIHQLVLADGARNGRERRIGR